ncbi:hypothetical protein LEI94_26770 [Salmonella enterica]|nr:hypothetical protein [Salmonella enterica]
MNIMSLSVKKSALAVVVCSSLGGIVPAMADAGNNPTLPAGGTSVSALTMHVVGSITNSTCNIRPYTSAGADATTLNLGVVSKGSASSPVSFFLKPENGCTDGIISVMDGKAASETATITWDSNGLTDHGISNMYGTATNVHLELKPVTGNSGSADGFAEVSTGAPEVIKTGTQTVNYKTLASGGKATPFKYEVKLASDDTKDMGAGTFDTDISYTVAYN